MTFSQKIKLRKRSFIIHLRKTGSIWRTCKYLFNKHIIRKELLVIKIRGYEFPIYLRNFTSDISIFAQIFINEDYKEGIKDLTSGKIIIDCGANIGLASLYFLQYFPDSSIYCFEPEDSNFHMLHKNVSHYKNIRIFKKAVWNISGGLFLNPNAPKDSFSVNEKESSKAISVDAISLNDFLNRNQLQIINLLKIDIEGAELDLFSKNIEWLEIVKVIIVEIHERMNPGSTNFINNLLKEKFNISYTGEYIKYTLKSKQESLLYNTF